MSFSTQTYSQRRKDLMQRMGAGLIILPANTHSSRNYEDNYYPFRQDSSFLYYSGIALPDLFILLDTDSGAEILYGEDVSDEHEIWMGPQPRLAELASQAGFQGTGNTEELISRLKLALKQNQSIHYLPPYQHGIQQALSDFLKVSLQEILWGISESLIHNVIAQRSIKSDEEAQQLDHAVKLTQNMHTRIMRHAQAGMKEAELVGLLHDEVSGGNGSFSFTPIVTIQGQILHNHHYGNTLKSGKLLLCDSGAEIPSGYAGDMTRTMPVDITFTDQQREIYDIVWKAETQCAAALRPGIPFKDIHLQAARIIFEGLKELGLTKGNTEEALSEGAHALFFPHGLGHMLGLDVHDMEALGEDYVGYDSTVSRNPQFGLKSLRLAKALQKGYALTVEPGLYFIPGLIKKWQASGQMSHFINFEKIEPYLEFGGVRIENNYLITENGSRLLGEAIPTSSAEIEQYRSEHL